MDALASASHPLGRRARSGHMPGRSHRLALWLPLTPLFVLLAPVVLIGSPLALLTRAGRRMAPWRAAWRVGAVLIGLSGLRIEVQNATVHIRIRIF